MYGKSGNERFAVPRNPAMLGTTVACRVSHKKKFAEPRRRPLRRAEAGSLKGQTDQ